MAGDNYLYVKGQTSIDSLPDDIVFDILVRIPAQDIYNSTRLVCRKWYQMIYAHNFIHAHLQYSTCGLVIQNWRDRTSHPTFVAMRQGRIEISKLAYNKLHYEPYHTVWSSCNGLLLGSYHISNPATKRSIALPTYFGRTIPGCSCAIAYAATSMEYKLVYTCYFRNGNSVSERSCAILTVGVLDKSWRCVRTEHLSLAAKKQFHVKPSMVTDGFVHWALTNTYVLTLNVETEIITQTRVPSCHDEKLEHYYLSMGSYLSLLIACSEFSWEVWEMKPETGEWTKMPKINLKLKSAHLNNCALNMISPSYNIKSGIGSSYISE
ncbi:hypothetical protein DH2020_023279 [Rehmannia glutinosa]|uniref:F-box domain-containing protein n=1 Tax=Rehmannia glutinosa TaxID=99300 RepID=A0ABR0W859_REHGL